jgi:hypothetical protein
MISVRIYQGQRFFGFKKMNTRALEDFQHKIILNE